jgi:hypothetical protein
MQSSGQIHFGYQCRWEAHIWIGKGINKQIYLGGYEKEEHAAEAYDMAALKTKGFDTPTNFSKDRRAPTLSTFHFPALKRPPLHLNLCTYIFTCTSTQID